MLTPVTDTFSTRRLLLCMAAAGLAFNTADIQAEMLRYTVEGTVHSDQNLAGSVVGESFVFIFTVDTDLLSETSPSVFEGSIGDFQVNISNSSENFAGSGGMLSVDAQSPSTSFLVQFTPSDGAVYTSTGSFVPEDIARLSLASYSGDLFTSDRTLSGLPTSLNHSNISSGDHFWLTNNTGFNRIESYIGEFGLTSFSAEVVPEPSSAAALGLGALALLRRKKQRGEA